MRRFQALATLALLVAPASAFASGPQRQNPYASLFKGQLDAVPQQKPSTPVLLPSPQSSQAAQSTICGMTVRQGDVAIDSKMPQHPPATAPKPTIKIVPVPACQK